jgi:GNAT superfamily N-acetyltransferase
MQALTIRRANKADVDTVATMWNRSAEWLKSIDSDQWQYPVKMENIEAAVKTESCWLVIREDLPIGTITLDTNAEPQYWHPTDGPANALYIHRMVVEGTERGSELGSAMLDWAGERAIATGREWIRLDAWRSNKALHQYYMARGFELVRVVEDPSGSGVCLQRRATVRLNRGPRLATVE